MQTGLVSCVIDCAQCFSVTPSVFQDEWADLARPELSFFSGLVCFFAFLWEFSLKGMYEEVASLLATGTHMSGPGRIGPSMLDDPWALGACVLPLPAVGVCPRGDLEEVCGNIFAASLQPLPRVKDNVRAPQSSSALSSVSLLPLRLCIYTQRYVIKSSCGCHQRLCGLGSCCLHH